MTVEKFITALGLTVSVYCIHHGSLALSIQWPQGRTCILWVDPVAEDGGTRIDFTGVPAPDALLITHAHGDHLDARLAAEYLRAGVPCIGSPAVAAKLQGAVLLRHGESRTVVPGVSVTAVPAYNTSEGHLQFHPKERCDNGYLIDIEGFKVYVAGDTEPTAEMAGMAGTLDLAFLPVNQPYTMTIAQAVEAAVLLAPKVLMPYHLTDTDLEALARALADALPGGDIRIRSDFR